MSDTTGMLLFFGAITCVVAIFLWNAIRHGSFKGAIFHATILKTVGTVEGVKNAVLKSQLRVHVLKRGRERLVGLELVSRSPMSYEMQPLSLNEAEAEKLILLLQAALKKSPTPQAKEAP